MTTVSAYAATSATAPLTQTEIVRRDVGPHDVAFDIHFAGICHSDIHTVKAEWGEPDYPVVPGHEIAADAVICADHSGIGAVLLLTRAALSTLPARVHKAADPDPVADLELGYA